MTGKEAFDYLVNGLKGKLGVRESIQIAKIYFQDLFEVMIPSLKSELTEEERKSLLRNIELLERGYPIAYLTGRSVFYGLDIHVNPSVLIPRPETEELVRWMIEDLKEKDYKSILDVGTGSGCIAISLSKILDMHSFTAIDISEEAIDLAIRNAMINDVKADFSVEDVFSDTFADYVSEFDVIVSNPPYICFKDERVGEETRLHEPHHALFASDEGLAFYKRFARILRKGQVLYLELNEYLAPEIKALFDDNSVNCHIRKDLQGKDRMMKVTF